MAKVLSSTFVGLVSVAGTANKGQFLGQKHFIIVYNAFSVVAGWWSGVRVKIFFTAGSSKL